MYSFRTILIWEELKNQLKVHIEYLCVMLINDIAFWGMHYIKVHAIIGISFTFFNLFILWITRHTFKKDLHKNLIIIGIGNTARDLTDIIRKNKFTMYDLLGYISVNDIPGITQVSKIDESLILGNYTDICSVLDNKCVREVIIAVPLADNDQMNHIVDKLEGNVDIIKFIPEFNGMFTFNTKIENYDGLMLVSAKLNYIRGFTSLVKRLFDILLSLLGVLALAPLTFFIWLKTDKEERKHGLFFTQERIGKDGSKLVIYKYRSMVKDADQILEHMLQNDEEIRKEYEKNKKLRNDPRVTDIGVWLRKTSLDEFPQFINVLKGEMSFIGPRPYLPREKKDMGSYYEKIIRSKPGITGMWQTHGRSETSFEERLKLDEYYYRNWSLWLDVVILFKTVVGTMRKNGAY
jgi:undecaprenyl-phosphate galactose phosphotransferase